MCWPTLISPVGPVVQQSPEKVVETVPVGRLNRITCPELLCMMFVPFYENISEELENQS